METLSMEALVKELAPHRVHVLAAAASLPFLAFLIGRMLRAVSRGLAGWWLCLAVHLAVVPGVTLAMTVGYLAVFTSTNLAADLDVVLYFAPIASMVFTLFAASRVMKLSQVPGLERIEGLFVTSAMGLGLLYAMSRMRLIAWLNLTAWSALGLVVAAILVLQLGWWMAFGRGAVDDEPAY